jgi:tetratricopeptide (TPR) repeat protein
MTALAGFAVLRSAIATRTDGFTIDDAYHIAAGVSYVKTGDFRLNPEHPPLVKLWVGAALARDFNMPPFRPLNDKLDERNFNEAAVFLQNDPDRVQARARVSMWVLNSILLLFLALAVARTFGNAVAAGTVLFLAIDPTIAAHLPVVLTDLSVGLLAATAVLFTVRAMRTAKWLDVSLAAASLGLTLGAKHSGLIAWLTVAAGGTAVLLVPKIVHEGLNRRQVAISLTAILLGSLIVLWGLYGFRYSETPSGVEAFNRPLTLKVADLHSPLSRGVIGLLTAGHVFPRAYVWGLADTIRAGVEGRENRIFFLGRLYPNRGPASYYSAVIGSKVPLGLFVLSLVGIALVLLRRAPQAWQLPGMALFALAVFFLTGLALGVSYAGIRHALPVLIVLSVCCGMSLAWVVSRRSARWSIFAAVALAWAAISAIPRLRPWEYYNELAGGCRNAYLRFGDEGVDMGERSADLIRYYRERLEPAGEVPYNFYPLSRSEMQRRRVHLRAGGTWGEEAKYVPPPGTRDATGVFFVSAARMMRNPDLAVFAHTPATERIGNVLIYRGTFHVPWLWQNSLTARATGILYSPNPNLDRAEAYLRQALDLNPKHFPALLQLGNVMLRRGRRVEAIEFYERARKEPAATPVQDALTRQIDRLSRNERFDQLQEIRRASAE